MGKKKTGHTIPDAIIFATACLTLACLLSSRGGGATTAQSSDTEDSALLSGTPARRSFSNVVVGSTSTGQTLKVANTGATSVKIWNATGAGTGFSDSGLSLPVALAAGGSTSFTVAFAPTAVGGETGNVSMASNATNLPPTVTLSGSTGTLLLGASPTSLSFGNVTVGSNSAQTVTLTNSGTRNITVSALTATGTGFTAGGLSLPASVAAGQSATFTVTYAPTAAGSATGSVSVVSNATNSPATVALSGAGMTALVVVSPTSIDFGRVMVNSTSSQSVTVQNTGTASVTLSQATVVGTGFSISGLSLPVSLATGQGTSFTVIFAPTAMGSATGSITLVSNARNSPTSVALDGAGRDAFSGW